MEEAPHAIVARSPEQLHSVIETVFSSGDVDGYAALYEEDATLVLPPAGQVLHGRADIREATAPLLGLLPRMSSSVVGKVQGIDYALTHARWTMSGVDPAGTPFEMTGRGTLLSRRRPDGTWGIVIDDAMSPS